MNQATADYAIIKGVTTNYNETIDIVKKALAEQGFGVLTEIDIAATLKKKINVDYPRTIILGACNPPLAHRGLTAAADIAVLLPCNVVVRENQQGSVEVAAMNPMIIQQHINNPEIGSVAQEVAKRLRSALDTLS